MNSLIREWLDPQESFNQLSFVWLGAWSPIMLIIIALMIITTLWLSWQNVKRLSSKRRLTLIGLRVIALGMFFILFLQPAARLEDISKVKNHVAVILDSSRSMALPDREGSAEPSRRSRAQEALIKASPTLEAWKRDDHQLDYFSLDGHLMPHRDQGALLKRPARGAETSLINGLNELSTRIPPRELAAVILLSDGGEWSASGQVDPPLKLMSAVERLGVPVHTLAVGPSAASRDLALAEVRADDFAFVRNVVSVDVDLRSYGFLAPHHCRVTLSRGQELLSERIIDFQLGQTRRSISFEFVPEETGEESYAVRIDPIEGEQVLENNLTRFSMRIIRDKIRALQVVGNPSWDQRFLRKHLKKNPNVDLISFFILRTNASLEVARPDELSLIPFPTQELFEERLGSFDLMIFQDFTFQGYRMGRYLPLIKEYVRKGGGFMMIGGDQSFSGGMYAGTPIEDILPFRLPPNGRDQVDLGAFTPTLSEIGAKHPITALSLVSEENQQLWSSLPPLEGTNRVGSLRRGAQVLAWRPETEGQKRAPLMVASTIGEGRSLAITTDSLWRWALSSRAVESGQGARAYHKLWSNAIRWLIRDPALNPLQVRADRDRYRLEDSLNITARSLDSSYQAVSGVSIELIIEEISEGMENAQEVYKYRGNSSDSGELSQVWKPTKEGAYRVLARSTIGEVDREAQDLFVVTEDLLELRDTTPRPDLLRAMSLHSGGEVILEDTDWSTLERRAPAIKQVNRREDVALWATWWALCLALFFPSIEWALRRRWGLS